MSTIELRRRGKPPLHAIIDDEDAPLVEGYTWHSAVDGRNIYAVTNVRRADGGYTSLRLHTLLTGWSFVDHVNGDGLDNRRENLRPSSKARNAMNSRSANGSSSQYKGVWWSPRHAKWRAKITMDGKARYLGYFENEAEAARAYDAAATELFGEHASLNFATPTSRPREATT